MILPIQLLCFESVSPRGRMNFHDGFKCLFSHLDPFLVLSSELSLLSFECRYGKNLLSGGKFLRLRISRDSNFGKRARRRSPQ